MFLLYNLKSIAILAVCFVHSAAVQEVGGAAGPFPAWTLPAIAPFAIPLFAFCSGYADGPINGNLNAHARSVFRLVALYVGAFYFWAAFKVLLSILRFEISFSVVIDHITALDEPGLLWFFIALIVWRICSPLVLELKAKASMVVVVIGIGFCSAFFTGDGQFDTVMRATLRNMPFYFLGIYLNRARIAELRESWKRHISLAALLLSVLVGFIAQSALDTGSSGFRKLESSFTIAVVYFVFLSVSVALIFVLVAYFPGKKIPLFTEFGSKSLTIYVFHSLVVGWFASLIVIPMVQGAPIFVFAVIQFALMFAACYLFSRNSVYKSFIKYTNFVYGILFARKA